MKTKRQREKRLLCMLRRPEGGAKATEAWNQRADVLHLETEEGKGEKIEK
jgi:hypothetical protein